LCGHFLGLRTFARSVRIVRWRQWRIQGFIGHRQWRIQRGERWGRPPPYCLRIFFGNPPFAV